MARIKFEADKDAESTGGGGGNNFAPKVRGFYKLQICEVSNGEVTSANAKTPGVPITKFRLEVAEGDQIGAYVYHNVVWTPRGTEEKAKPGHGMAVHWLHATSMPFSGKFDFDEDDFLKPEHALINALLEVEPYEKIVSGKSYTNEKYVIREVYTEAHPQPDELPPPPKPKAPRAAVGAVAPAGAVAGRKVDDDVPF